MQKVYHIPIISQFVNGIWVEMIRLDVMKIERNLRSETAKKIIKDIMQEGFQLFTNETGKTVCIKSENGALKIDWQCSIVSEDE